MIYNYTKCESVIAKVMSDLNISEKNIRITDMREWIFEAVDKIGAPMQYIHKESGVDGEPILCIQDGQVPIPCGLQHLDAVAYSDNNNGPWKHVRSNTAAFKGQKLGSAINHRHRYHETEPVKALLLDHSGRRYGKDLIVDNEDVTCFIKPGWIVFNRKKGFAKLAYKTIATDERGYPLIPDLTSYQEAVYWYVVMKLNFPKFLSGKLGGKGVNSAQNTYFYIQNQWNFYRNQAYAECMMPTAADMESIKNDWNKLLPEFEEEDTFFKSQGEEQIIYNDYYYGY